MAKNWLKGFLIHEPLEMVFQDAEPEGSMKRYLRNRVIEKGRDLAIRAVDKILDDGNNDNNNEETEPSLVLKDFTVDYIYPQDIVKTTRGRFIRLLELLPGDPDEDIHCVINNYVLSPGIEKYEALSYVWGSPEDTKTIYVSGASLEVTVNLHSALKHLRRTDESRVLWVDAVCIDQTDLDERTHQVSLMGDIYRTTESVIVWLGEGNGDTKSTFRLLRALAREEMDESELNVSQTYHIKKMLNNDWFRRSWTVQEILSAPRGLVVCGHESISWYEFSEAIMDASLKDTMAPMTRHMGPFHRQFDKLLSLHEASELLSQHRLPHQELQELLIRFRGRGATDLRDKIYRLLGLVSDREALGIKVDYRISIAELYRNVAAELILQSGSLDVLNFLPSWTELDEYGPDGGFIQFYDESWLPSWSPCWGKRVQNPIPFHDSPPFITAGVDVEECSDIWFSEDRTTLSVSGYIFDEIRETTDYLPQATHMDAEYEEEDHQGFREKVKEGINQIYTLMRPLEVLLQWEAFAGLPTQDADSEWVSDEVVDTYWKTLCAGTLLPDGEADTKAAFWEWYHILDPFRSEKEKWYDDSPSLSKIIRFSKHVRAIWDELPRFEQVSNVAFYRRLAWSGTGRLALVPQTTRVGDSIMLCGVSDFPLVVRRMEDQENWRIVGPAYIHGLDFDPGLCQPMHFI